jgi:iron-sulfur cluster assembly accessory protein
VDRAAHLVSEDAIYELMLLDAAEALEAVRGHLCPEVVAPTRQILHLGGGAGQGGLDALLEVIGGRHASEKIATGYNRVVVTLTDVAAEKVRGFIDSQETDDVGLRVGVRGGGCSGFQYALALDNQKDEDHVFDYEGIRLIVDPASMRYVDGSTVDYTESLMGAGFEVNNPNVVASCGCGSSFRIADEDPSCGS